MAPDPVVHWLLRALLALLFASSAVHKLRDPAAFVARLRDYRLLPGALAGPAAAGLVAVEGAAALGLVWPACDPAGPLVAVALLSTYAAAIGANLARGRRHIDCGCLGPAAGQTLSGGLVVRNLGLAALAALLWLEPVPRALTWLDAPSLVGGAGLAVLLWQAAHRLGAVGVPAGRPA